MTRIYTSHAAKKLALRYILENIDYRKRCLYLQEIISMGRKNDVWRQALTTFFESPIDNLSLSNFSRN